MKRELVTVEQAADLLRDWADPGYPVEVVRRKMRANWGTTEWDAEREVYVVRIEKDCDETLAVRILIHEWAHTHVWDASTESDHDELWGVAYSRCYQAVHGK